MEDKLISILETFGYPVFLQGSLNREKEFPDSFFTFWNDSSDGNFADNDEFITKYEYSVNFYSTDSELVYIIMRDAVKLLRENDFILSGDGRSVPSGVETHDGRGIDVRYIKTLEKEN